MPSISRRRNNKNRALKRTRKIKSRRVRKNSQSAGGLFGSAGNKISGFFKTLKSKTPKVSSKMFEGLRKRLSRKKPAQVNNRTNPSNRNRSNPLANASPSASNSAGNGNGNKAKNGKGNQPNNGNGNKAKNGKVNQANNGKAKQPANVNRKPANGNNTKPPANSPQSNNVVPPNTPVNANKATPPTNNGGNGQNKKI